MLSAFLCAVSAPFHVVKFIERNIEEERTVLIQRTVKKTENERKGKGWNSRKDVPGDRP